MTEEQYEKGIRFIKEFTLLGVKFHGLAEAMKYLSLPSGKLPHYTKDELTDAFCVEVAKNCLKIGSPLE